MKGNKEKDITQKILEGYNDVFADIINVLLFNGENVILEDSLTDALSIQRVYLNSWKQMKKSNHM